MESSNFAKITSLKCSNHVFLSANHVCSEKSCANTNKQILCHLCTNNHEKGHQLIPIANLGTRILEKTIFETLKHFGKYASGLQNLNSSVNEIFKMLENQAQKAIEVSKAKVLAEIKKQDSSNKLEIILKQLNTAQSQIALDNFDLNSYIRVYAGLQKEFDTFCQSVEDGFLVNDRSKQIFIDKLHEIVEISLKNFVTLEKDIGGALSLVKESEPNIKIKSEAKEKEPLGFILEMLKKEQELKLESKESKEAPKKTKRKLKREKRKDAGSDDEKEKADVSEKKKRKGVLIEKGIKKDISLDGLKRKGWDLYLEENYAEPFEQIRLTALKKKFKKDPKTKICVGAIDPKDDYDNLVVCGFANLNEALKKTISYNKAKFLDDGYWYNVTEESFGFSNREEIDLEGGDNRYGSFRLSWPFKESGYVVEDMEFSPFKDDYFIKYCQTHKNNSCSCSRKIEVPRLKRIILVKKSDD